MELPGASLNVIGLLNSPVARKLKYARNAITNPTTCVTSHLFAVSAVGNSRVRKLYCLSYLSECNEKLDTSSMLMVHELQKSVEVRARTRCFCVSRPCPNVLKSPDALR